MTQNPDVSVMLEAGGDDIVPSVLDSAHWPTNIGNERDWDFRGVPNPRLNGHSIDFVMGKVLGSQKRDWGFIGAEPTANRLRSFRRRDRPLPGLVD